jgi:YtkA-like
LFGIRSFGIFASSLCLLAQFPLSGCSKPNRESSDIHFQYENQPNPPHVGSNVFIVKLNGKDGSAVSGAHVSMEGDMSHPGMSPAFAEMKEVNAGTYRGDLNLAMRGDWIVEFHIALADGRKIEQQAELRDVKK